MDYMITDIKLKQINILSLKTKYLPYHIEDLVIDIGFYETDRSKNKLISFYYDYLPPNLIKLTFKILFYNYLEYMLNFHNIYHLNNLSLFLQHFIFESNSIALYCIFGRLNSYTILDIYTNRRICNYSKEMYYSFPIAIEKLLNLKIE